MLQLDIKNLMDQRDINRFQLAKKLEIGYKAVNNLYSGGTNRIYFETLEKLCVALQCTPNDLFTSDDPEFNKLIHPNNKEDGTK